MRATLESWRDGLLDLTGANPLIDVRATAPGVVEIVSPSPRSIVEALQQGRECGFLGIEEQAEGPRPRATHVFQTAMTDAEMDTTLRALRRAAHRDLLEQGIASLYLGLGTVRWRDDGSEHVSPILLIPVDLVTPDPQDYPRLRVRAEDPIVNPALDICLRRHNIELPAVDSLAALDVTVFWARLDAALGDHPDWHSDEAVMLTRFAVHREVMYTDLLDHERQILAHPVVRALATGPEGQSDAFKFDVISGRRIDELASPDDVPLVLDADAAQRACITAALHGRTFVMRGAPGTGKSQTIANMIGCLLHAGRRVLFVAEKAAALDTVRDRLAPSGLDDYLLELHSGRTGRHQVAAALAAALDFIPLPPPDLSTDEREALREHRQRLNAYAEAMNEVREPLGHRLHDVLGMCAQMTDVPQGPALGELPIPLTTQSLQRVRDAAERLSRAWRPAREGDDFLWRDVIDHNRLDARLHQAQTALDHLSEAIERDPLAEAFAIGTIGEALTLTTLVGHATRRPPEAADEWLTMHSLEPVARAAEGLLRHLTALHQAEDAVRARAGVTWSALPSPSKLPIIPSLSHLRPPAVELLPLTAAQARGLARRFADEADRLEQHQHSLDRVTARLGLPNVVAFTDLPRLATIVELLSRPDKPEPAWFDGPGLNAAHAAMRHLRRAVNVVKAAETRAREYFTENALAEPVDELAERFAHQYRGIRKLRAPYRRDKRAAAQIARSDVKRSQAVANLSAAAAWKRALQELDEAEAEHAGILGRHWQRLDTDFEAIERALRTAEETLQVTPPEALPTLIERICAPTPNSAIIRIVGEAGKEFDRWTAALRPPPEHAPRPQLGAGPIHDAVTWLRAHVEPLTAVAELVQAYSAAAGRDFTLAEAAAIGLLRESAAEAAAALSANAKEYARVLGSAYRGTQTDVEALATAMAWTSEARRIRNGADIAFTPEQAELLGRARLTDVLPARVAEWQAARDWILRAFAPSRHPSLGAALGERDSAGALLREFLEDSQGQQEWFEHRAARAILAEHGLDAVVDFCAAEDLPVEQILPVLGRALFESWADAIIRDDDRLAPLDAVSRDRLVDEFRIWDLRLQRAAAAEVMNAVDALQPAEAAAGEAALLRASAAQHGNRLPVRDLFARTMHAAMAVKPCLVMSPADVSRLLPAGLPFDVVIIDEASRVPVPDALTCVYRGNALVICGDDRQLTAAPLPGGDQRSILELALACGAFRTLDLATHYRSRDESLIAFANHAFYQGRLNTFPAFAPAGPDGGVQLYPATGEQPLAEVVATRVAHHLVTRPELTLGVVVCTPQDAAAVEAAVADMVVPPEDDRLRGFFIKDLDAVQGDERDVVIFAIGDEFDDLRGADGWRRLNVAITRARRRVEVVSALRARDLPDGDDSLRHLAGYLDYAARGMTALRLEEPDGVESQTPFEDSVRDVIRGWGYRVHTRVGAGAFRIDLAVRRSARRNAPYALGIECDGTTYDSAPTARDRDRIREQVLTGLGWRLHRIWGTAWYLDRQREEARLRAAIEEAFATLPDAEVPQLAVATTPAAEKVSPSAEKYSVAEAAESYAAGYGDTAAQTEAPVVPAATAARADDRSGAGQPAFAAQRGRLVPEAGEVRREPVPEAELAAAVSGMPPAAEAPEGASTQTAARPPEAGSVRPVARVPEAGPVPPAAQESVPATPGAGARQPQPVYTEQAADESEPVYTEQAADESESVLAEHAAGQPVSAFTEAVADELGAASNAGVAAERLLSWTDADDLGLAGAEAAAEADLAAAHAADGARPAQPAPAEPHDGALVPDFDYDEPPPVQARGRGAEPILGQAAEADVAATHAAEHAALARVSAEFAAAQAGAEELAAAEAYLGTTLESTVAELRPYRGEDTGRRGAHAARTGEDAAPAARSRAAAGAGHTDPATWPTAPTDRTVRAEWPFASRADAPDRVAWPLATGDHPAGPGGRHVSPVQWPAADREAGDVPAAEQRDPEQVDRSPAEDAPVRAEWPFASRADVPERVEWPSATRPQPAEPGETAEDAEGAGTAFDRPTATREEPVGRGRTVTAFDWPSIARPEPAESGRAVSPVDWPVASREEPAESGRTVTPVEWPVATRGEPVEWPVATRGEPVESPAATGGEPAEPERMVSPADRSSAALADRTAASREDLAEVAARFGVGTEELAAAAAQFLAGLHETTEPADRLGAISQIRAELTSTDLSPDLADAAATVAERSVHADAGEAPRPTWYQAMEGQPDIAAAVAEFEETMAAPPGWIHHEEATVEAAPERGRTAVSHADEWARPYRKANLAPLPPGAVLTDPGLRPALVAAVRRLAEIEGPVHISVVLQRMREQWGLTRITRPARAAVEAAIEEAGVVWDGAFLADPRQGHPVVRRRAQGVARKADQISDAELAVALENLVIDGGVMAIDELLAAVTKLYGWSTRRSTALDARLTGLMADLVAAGHLVQQPDGLSAAHGLPDPLHLPHHDSARRLSRHRR
ncbi:DUF3320 domain-containing protein [Actinoplanes teichomyceticus]|uniref:DUF3320 domain-containing protein n=1 Tax=Actinoplanes teichomyceticus TaxID=1867 RepID=UPI0021CCC476|nr:DUF3320 domain-containing protein [Actinoplanes teichomyceticus]